MTGYRWKFQNPYAAPRDYCAYVYVCGFGDWQVQAAPRALSDMGGAQALFEAIAYAHKDHMLEAHTDAQWEAMRLRLKDMGADEALTGLDDRDGKSGLFYGIELPKWWVHK